MYKSEDLQIKIDGNGLIPMGIGHLHQPKKSLSEDLDWSDFLEDFGKRPIRSHPLHCGACHFFSILYSLKGMNHSVMYPRSATPILTMYQKVTRFLKSSE